MGSLQSGATQRTQAKGGKFAILNLRVGPNHGGLRSIRSIARSLDRVDRFDRFDNFSFVQNFWKF